MNEPITNQYRIDERADKQLQLIEQTLDALLKDVSLQDLTSNQRLNFATKMLLPYARMLALQYTIKRTQSPATKEEAFSDELRQCLRLSLEEMPVDAPFSHTHVEK